MSLTKKKYHSNLSTYFLNKSLWFDEVNKEKPNRRKLSEQPWQQTNAELWEELETTLCDLWFVDAKAMADQLQQLLNDYDFALTYFPENKTENEDEKKRQLRIKKYTSDLIEFANGKIKEINIIPSIEIWDEQKIISENKRIVDDPSSIDNIKSFKQFASLQYNALENGKRFSHYCIQHAHNSSNSGIIASRAKQIIEFNFLFFEKHPLLLQVSDKSDYNYFNPLSKILSGYHEEVSNIDLTPDGNFLVSCGKDESVIIWDTQNQGNEKVINIPDEEIYSVAISADGNKTIAGCSSGRIYVLNVVTRSCLNILYGHLLGISKLMITPNGKYLASYSKDQTIRIWNLEIGECIHVIEVFDKEIHSLSLNATGTKLICHIDKSIFIWDVQQKIATVVSEISDLRIEIMAVLLGADKIYFGVHAQPFVFVYDLENNLTTKINFDDVLVSGGLKITADERFMVYRSKDCMKIWDIKENYLLGKIESSDDFKKICLTSSGDRAVTINSYGDSFIKFWNIGTPDINKKNKNGIIDKVRENCIVSNYKKVFTTDNKSILEIDPVSLKVAKKSEVFNGYELQKAIAISPDSKRIVLTSSISNPSIWDTESGTMIKSLDGKFLMEGIVCISPDGKLIATGGFDKRIHVWDLEDEKCVMILKGDTEIIRLVSFTIDGKYLVSASNDNSIKVWELESGELKFTLIGHSSYVNSILFPDDNKQLISIGNDQKIIYWLLETGTCLKTQDLPNINVNDACLLPDGTTVVLACDEGKLIFWDINKNKQTQIFIDSSNIERVCYCRDRIVITKDSHELKIIKSINPILVSTPKSTPAKIWKFENANAGAWDLNYTVQCYSCGERSIVSENILKLIESHNDPESPKNETEMNCSNCNSIIIVNSFFARSFISSEIISQNLELSSSEKKIENTFNEITNRLNKKLDLALAHDKAGNIKEAEKLYCDIEKQLIENSLEKDHLLARVLNNYGSLLVEQNRLEEAEIKLNRATEISSTFSNPWYWIAKLYQKRNYENDKVLEKEAWKKYLQLDPMPSPKIKEAEDRLIEIS